MQRPAELRKSEYTLNTPWYSNWYVYHGVFCIIRLRRCYVIWTLFYFGRERPACRSDSTNVRMTLRPVNSVTSLGFKGALQKENYRLLSVFENFAAKRLDISFRFRQAVLEILFERWLREFISCKKFSKRLLQCVFAFARLAFWSLFATKKWQKIRIL